MEQTFLLTGLALVASAVLYRSVWRRRFRDPSARGSGAVRLVGRICGPGPAGESIPAPGSFELEGASFGVVHLDGTADLATGRVMRVGDRVTVDGVPRLVPGPLDETLYREHGRVPGVDATRVTLGGWPRLRWLVPAAAVGAIAVVAIGVARPYWVSPRRLLVERSEQKTRCPERTVRETRIGPDGVLHRCRHQAGHLHGIYAIWSWAGELVERGQWVDGRRDAVRDVILGDGKLRRSTYLEGQLHGPVFVLDQPFGRVSRRRYHAEYVRGRLHGIERGWHANGTRAFVRYYLDGWPRGTWTNWDHQGRVVARGPGSSLLLRAARHGEGEPSHSMEQRDVL